MNLSPYFCASFCSVAFTSARPRWASFPNDARAAILCLPFAGGGASFYRSWHAFTPETIAICPVQPPGREERSTEPCLDRMGVMVAAAGVAIGIWSARGRSFTVGVGAPTLTRH